MNNKLYWSVVASWDKTGFSVQSQNGDYLKEKAKAGIISYTPIIRNEKDAIQIADDLNDDQAEITVKGHHYILGAE